MNIVYFTIFNLIFITFFVYGQNGFIEECNSVKKLLKKELINDCCSEKGITCDLNGHIVKIMFGSNQLNGTIPSELGNLSNLEILLLNNCQFNGIIPPELGKLSNLKELNLVGNKFNGVIPSELGKLSKLTNLSLNNNQFSGTIPQELGNLSKLTFLNLSNNNLTGSIPPEFEKLSNLKGLHLNNNQLSGTIPPELGNLSELSILNLSNNQFNGSIPSEFEKLSNLKELDISSNDFCGNITKLSNSKITTNGNQKLGQKCPDDEKQQNTNNKSSQKIILIIVGVSALLLILIILAYFKIKNNNGNSNISKKEKYFEWKIENWNQRNDEEFSFTFEANGHLWKLKLITNSFNEYNEESIDVGLTLCDYIKNDESIYTNFVIYFRNYNNNKVFKEVEYDGKPTCYNTKSLTHGINDAILKSELYEKTNDECSLLENNKIIIGILIKFYSH